MFMKKNFYEVESRGRGYEVKIRSYPHSSLSWAFFDVFVCQEHRSEKKFQKNAFFTNCPSKNDPQ